MGDENDDDKIPTLKDGDCSYKVEWGRGEATLTGLDDSVEGSFVLPRTLGGCLVTGIDKRAFTLSSGLTSIKMPVSVTRIEDGTFNSCDALTEIHVEEDNPRYRSIDGVLFDKEGLRLIRCPLCRSGDYAVPVGVIGIADRAFSCCSFLTDVTLPRSVRSLGERAFTCCTLVKSFTVDEENPFFLSKDCILFSKDGAELIQYPLGKTERYTVPAGVTRIAKDAFRGKALLTSVDVDEANDVFSGFDGILYDKGRTRIVQVPTGIRGKIRIPGSVVAIVGFSLCSDLTEVVIEHGVTGIADGAFIRCVRLANVTIPESVISIGSSAFADCARLRSITIPERVTRIESGMFSGCRQLTKVVYGQGVTEIGDSAFRNCRRLAELTLPQGLVRIGESAFKGCSNLKKIAIPIGIK